MRVIEFPILQNAPMSCCCKLCFYNLPTSGASGNKSNVHVPVPGLAPFTSKAFAPNYTCYEAPGHRYEHATGYMRVSAAVTAIQKCLYTPISWCIIAPLSLVGWEYVIRSSACLFSLSEQCR